MIPITHFEGRLVADPEIRETTTNVVTRFRLACSDNRLTTGGAWESVRQFFITVKAWDHLAKPASELSKGEQVTVKGKLETRSWTDDQGNQRSGVELNAMDILTSIVDARTGVQAPAYSDVRAQEAPF